MAGNRSNGWREMHAHVKQKCARRLEVVVAECPTLKTENRVERCIVQMEYGLMGKAMVLVCLMALNGPVLAGNCPTGKQSEGLLTFEVVVPPKNTMLKPPLVVVGDGWKTWIRYPKDTPWAAPFVRLKDGTDLSLSWRRDGDCMVVALGGQDFQLGYKGEEVWVRRTK